MKMEENKGVIALVLLLGIAIGAWDPAVTIATLIASIGVIIYSGIKHEEWLEHFFEP